MGWELSLLLLGEDDGEEVWDISENESDDDLGVHVVERNPTPDPAQPSFSTRIFQCPVFGEMGGWFFAIIYRMQLLICSY